MEVGVVWPWQSLKGMMSNAALEGIKDPAEKVEFYSQILQCNCDKVNNTWGISTDT